MVTATERIRPPGVGAGQRFGYFVGAVVNGLLLWAAHNLLDWDIVPFLTERFDEVLPAITRSFVVTIAAYLLRVVYPARWFVAVSEVFVLLANLYATIALWRIFPFDFDDHWSGWELLGRGLLIIVIIGTAIGLVAQVVKLVVQRPHHQTP